MIKYNGKIVSETRHGKRGATVTEKERYYLLDSMRGVALLFMILYHTLWDIINLFGVSADWFTPSLEYMLQRFICMSFIMLSGFCSQIGRHPYKRALILIGASVIIFAVTLIFMPSNIIVFGVLTLLGLCSALIVPLEKLLRRIDAYLGFLIFTVLFLATEWINAGFLGLPGFGFYLPAWLYANHFTAFFGFPHEEFVSADYFSVFPWIFVFIMGYFVYRIFSENKLLRLLKTPRIRPLEWIGRKTLIIYMLHQPVIYGALYLVFLIF